MFEKIILNNLYSYLNANNLVTKNQSGFRPGDSTTNQLLYLVNDIHQAFEKPKSLEVRAVFLAAVAQWLRASNIFRKSPHLSGAGSSPVGSVSRDLNSQNLHY